MSEAMQENDGMQHWRTQITIWGCAVMGRWDDLAALVERRWQWAGRWWDLTQADLDRVVCDPPMSPGRALLPAMVGEIWQDRSGALPW